jgi:hypothetical protein
MFQARAFAVALAASILAAGPVALAGEIVYVDDDAPPGGDGATWKSAYRFLQDALTAAQQPGSGINEIRVAQGVYKPDHSERNPDGTQDQAATFSLIDQVAIKGGYAGIGHVDPDARDIEVFQTHLSGDLAGDDEPGAVCAAPSHADNSNNIIVAGDVSPTTILDGLFIVGATNELSDEDGAGGGMRVNGGNPTMVHCTFDNNTSWYVGGAAVYSVGGNLSFMDCTFTGGCTIDDDARASGILSIGGSILLIECAFVDNWHDGVVRVSEGGSSVILNCLFGGDAQTLCCGAAALTNIDATSFLSGCTFEGITNEGAGAISNNNSVCSILDSSFVDCRADVAGAISSQSSQLFVNACLFLSNFGSDFPEAGGSITSYTSDVVILNSEFVQNLSPDYAGGAINNHETHALVVNCAFSGNEARRGGALANFASSPIVVNCSFSHNLADPFFVSDTMWSDVASSPQMVNCIIWNNQFATIGGPGTPTISFSDIEGGWSGPGTNNISADPMFVDADGPDNDPGTIDDNLRLLPGSPCIDAGDNTAVPADEFDLDADGDTAEPIPFDLAGLPRFLDDPKTIDSGNGTPPIVDMGAYEFNCGNNTLDLTGDGVVDAADLAQLLAQWGPCAPSPPAPLPGGEGCLADSTGDGVVDAADLAAMLANWC